MRKKICLLFILSIIMLIVSCADLSNIKDTEQLSKSNGILLTKIHANSCRGWLKLSIKEDDAVGFKALLDLEKSLSLL